MATNDRGPTSNLHRRNQTQLIVMGIFGSLRSRAGILSAMLRISIGLMLATGAALAKPAPPTNPAAPTLLGRWRVVGCATSPRDPADCAKGEIVFEAKRWKVELSCCKRSRAYVVVSSAPDRITISSEGEQSEIVIDAKGEAQWNPGGLGGRVGALSFVRKTR